MAAENYPRIMASSLPSARIPPGSWILVTGANGFIASWTIKALLEAGYRVRGTVRDLRSASWLTKGVFHGYAATGLLVLVAVSDIKAKGALDAVLDDVFGVIHIAGTFDPGATDARKVIDAAMATNVAILNAAASHPSIKVVVFTGNSTSAAPWQPGAVRRVEEDSWMEDLVSQALAALPNDPAAAALHRYIVFFAAKMQAEKAVWRFVKEKKPYFAVNVVTPWTVFGPSLDAARGIQSTSAFLKGLYDGDKNALPFLTTSQFSIAVFFCFSCSNGKC
jgi:nucleoside-diphosphate-sugar epimerase